jgi:hypothetical protein
MKTTLTVLFTSWMALVAIVQGETYRSLNGYLDTVEIAAGETALIVSVTHNTVLGIKTKGEYPQQYRFASPKKSCHCHVVSGRRTRHNVFPTPSRDQPVYIAGPVTLTLRTAGFLTLVLPEERRRASTSSPVRAVRRFVSN